MTDDVDSLLQQLAEGDATARREAVEALADAFVELEDPHALEALIGALGDRETEVRAHAAWMLGHIRAVPAVEPIIALLAEADREIRFSAVWALGEIGDARAADPLMRMLADEDTEIRAEAAAGLGATGDARAIQPLLAILADGDDTLRETAAVALGSIGEPCVVGALCRALEDGSEMLRSRILRALDSMGGKELPARIVQSRDMTMEERLAALEALRNVVARHSYTRYSSDGFYFHYKVPDARRLCQRMAEGTDADARQAALEMLAYLDTQELLTPAAAPDSDAEREQLLRMPDDLPGDHSADELLRQSSMPEAPGERKPGGSDTGALARLWSWVKRRSH